MKKVKLKDLLDKNKKYCGKVETTDNGDVLLVFEEDAFYGAKKKLDQQSKKMDPAKLTTFNRFMFAPVFQISMHKGMIGCPKFAKNRMRIPWKYKEVIIDEEIDIFAQKLFDNSVCITEFIPQNIFVNFLRKIQYRKK